MLVTQSIFIHIVKEICRLLSKRKKSTPHRVIQQPKLFKCRVSNIALWADTHNAGARSLKKRNGKCLWEILECTYHFSSVLLAAKVQSCDHIGHKGLLKMVFSYASKEMSICVFKNSEPMGLSILYNPSSVFAPIGQRTPYSHHVTIIH